MSSNHKKPVPKDARWDRIRKKHANALNIKTETVKKFIELDLIGKREMQLLNGDLDHVKNLDPLLVMDLRHEQIDRKPQPCLERRPSSSEKITKAKVHNMKVEERYIEGELNKFKLKLQQAAKATKAPKIETTENNVHDFILTSSLKGSKKKEIVNGHVQFHDENKTNCNSFEEKREEVPINGFNHSPSKNNVNGNSVEKNVRFEESVEVINYSRENSLCSNTSEDVDSVISEFIEEVIHEIEFEAFEEEHSESELQSVECSEKTSYEKEPSDNKLESVECPVKNRINTKKFENKADPNRNKPTVKEEELHTEEFLKIVRIPEESNIKLVVEIHSEEEESSSQSESISNEQDEIIAQLFLPKCPPTETILRRYFLKWIHYTTLASVEKHNLVNKTSRVQKINAFLDKIRREKGRFGMSKPQTNNERKGNNAVVTKKYEKKIKMQQDIIQLQQLKLDRQERMIMELKLSKFSDEAKKAKEELKSELRSVIKNGHIKHRTKAKCLQLVANLRDEEDEEFEKLQGKALMMPKFLAKMQERAIQRSIKHEQARQRRLQIEAEKEAAKIAMEEAKRLEDEEAKRQRIEALKEKRRQEKLAKIMKERERQRYLENMKKSEQFCRRRLLSRVGMEAFKRILILKRKNLKKAENFRKRTTKQKMLSAWNKYYISLWTEKFKKADDLHKKLVMRSAFRGWRAYMSTQQSKFLAAIDWSEYKITEFYLRHWVGITKIEKIIEQTKMKQAQSHHHWHLKWKVLDRWQRLPQVLKLEKETEIRRQRWRMKIWELLPDYTPNRDEI